MQYNIQVRLWFWLKSDVDLIPDSPNTSLSDAASLTDGLGVAVECLRVGFLAVQCISLLFEAFSLTVEGRQKQRQCVKLVQLGQQISIMTVIIILTFSYLIISTIFIFTSIDMCD